MLRQQKTGHLIEIPLHDRLAPLVRQRLADALVDYCWSQAQLEGRGAYRNFARSWDAVRRTAGIVDRQRRDCRRTAVIRLAQAGATVPQIASVSGWASTIVSALVDTYLPRRTEVAASAIAIREDAIATDARVSSLAFAGTNGLRNDFRLCQLQSVVAKHHVFWQSVQ
jgi:hypothetical protein